MARYGRRTVLKSAVGLVAMGLLPDVAWARKGGGLLTKRIPKSGETVPVIGMGTWITFNVGGDQVLRDARSEVLRTFFELGGSLIDSSPMYGSAQEVVGYALDKIGRPLTTFAADKIWTRDGKATRAQFGATRKLWQQKKPFDLMQVHNLLSWEDHLASLRALKANGKIRYIGVTTSHGRRHRELEQLMKTQDIDFVQLTYNMVDREVEKRLLPLARERNIAVIANRPLDGGALMDRLNARKEPVPTWMKEIDVTTWSQFALKWIVSHPAVTVAIPATSKVAHMRENMGACHGALADEKLRARMLAHIA